MRHAFGIALSLFMGPLAAQTAADVGLHMDGGILTVLYGQSCGPFTCQPFVAGPIGAGSPRNVITYGAPTQIHVLAIGLDHSQPCLSIPGFANSLILQQPITLAVGVNGQGSLTSVCPQGRALYRLQFPVGTPPGVAFQLQALTMSFTLGMPAFTIAIRSMTA